MIPLGMRRSSWRCGPGWFVGRYGSIFDHCSSENQNKCESIGQPPNLLASPLGRCRFRGHAVKLTSPAFRTRPD